MLRGRRRKDKTEKPLYAGLSRLNLLRGAGDKPKRRSDATEGVGSVQGGIYSASS